MTRNYVLAGEGISPVAVSLEERSAIFRVSMASAEGVRRIMTTPSRGEALRAYTRACDGIACGPGEVTDVNKAAKKLLDGEARQGVAEGYFGDSAALARTRRWLTRMDGSKPWDDYNGREPKRPAARKKAAGPTQADIKQAVEILLRMPCNEQTLQVLELLDPSRR